MGKQSIISNRGQQYQPDELISETTAGGFLRGTLDGRIGFYLDAGNSLTEVTTRSTKKILIPSQGSPVVISGANVYQDRALAYWTWQSNWFRLQLGRDEFSWGPGFMAACRFPRICLRQRWSA